MFHNKLFGDKMREGALRGYRREDDVSSHMRKWRGKRQEQKPGPRKRRPGQRLLPRERGKRRAEAAAKD